MGINGWIDRSDSVYAFTALKTKERNSCYTLPREKSIVTLHSTHIYLSCHY